MKKIYQKSQLFDFLRTRSNIRQDKKREVCASGFRIERSGFGLFTENMREGEITGEREPLPGFI